MILIPLNENKRVSHKFRKAPYFGLLHENLQIMENRGKRLKQKEFLHYLKQFEIDSIFVLNIGAKTAKSLIEEGFQIFMIQHDNPDTLITTPLAPLCLTTLPFLATLGHR